MSNTGRTDLTGEPTPISHIAAALRRERERLGLSLTEVARRAGVAKSTLSQLEAGSGNPSVETLWALSVALDVPLSRLIEPPRQTVRVVRAGQGPVMHSDQAHYAASLLASSPPHARRDLYRISAAPGEPRLSDPHGPGTIEHVVLGAGRARVGLRADPVEVGPGDYVCFPGDEPHLFEALEDGTVAVIVMEHV